MALEDSEDASWEAPGRVWQDGRTGVYPGSGRRRQVQIMSEKEWFEPCPQRLERRYCATDCNYFRHTRSLSLAWHPGKDWATLICLMVLRSYGLRFGSHVISLTFLVSSAPNSNLSSLLLGTHLS